MMTTLSTCTYVYLFCMGNVERKEGEKKSSGNVAPFIFYECNKLRPEEDDGNVVDEQQQAEAEETEEEIDLLKITHICTRVWCVCGCRCYEAWPGERETQMGKNQSKPEALSSTTNDTGDDEKIYGMMVLKIIRCTIRLFFSFRGERACVRYDCFIRMWHCCYIASNLISSFVSNVV